MTSSLGYFVLLPYLYLFTKANSKISLKFKTQPESNHVVSMVFLRESFGDARWKRIKGKVSPKGKLGKNDELGEKKRELLWVFLAMVFWYSPSVYF
ncbi:hypothetical protein COLO4_20621 [Corchorus olitorius]|uniref:Uncharacterized protein n=1 Tax=Corchorus olitorius TaxID=93759 RepID=A0A1R3IYP3_9ROSI|nr:hypothetical protein COLO4_20621 [Corchorus olitorius]